MEDDAEQWGVDLEIAVVSMNPRSLNLFMKKLTRERVVPTISASVSCEIFGIRCTGRS